MKSFGFTKSLRLDRLDWQERTVMAIALKQNGVGLSQGDTAAVTGLTRSNVEQAEKRALAKIRKAFEVAR